MTQAPPKLAPCTGEPDAPTVTNDALLPAKVGVRAGPWKLVHWAETGVNELFDVEHDPDERADESSSHQALAKTLEAISERWQAHSRYLIENYAEVLAASGRRCSGTAP